MDKVTLSKEQMATVVDFIESRGFHAPHVIVEILDHFACKVEEKLTEQPGISLDRAMNEAHRDFGTLGFYPFVASYEKSTKRKYRLIYWAEMKKLLLHPLTIALTAIGFYLVFKAYEWSNTHFYNQTLGMNGMQMVLFGMVVVYILLIRRWAGYKYRENKLFMSIMPVNTMSIIFPMVAVTAFHPGELMNTRQVLFGGSIYSFACVTLVLHTIALYYTIREGRRENRQVLDYISSITS